MEFLTIISDCGLSDRVNFDLAQLGHKSKTASNSANAISSFLRFKPDIVFVELEHSRLYGIDLAYDLCALNENAHVAVLCSDPTPALVLETIRAGCVAVIRMPLCTNSIKNAIWDIVNLGSHFAADQIESAALISAGVVDLQMTLCDREMRILSQLAAGKSARAIAYQLNTSEKHIRRSLDRIRCKTSELMDEHLLRILNNEIRKAERPTACEGWRQDVRFGPTSV